MEYVPAIILVLIPIEVIKIGGKVEALLACILINIVAWLRFKVFGIRKITLALIVINTSALLLMIVSVGIQFPLLVCQLIFIAVYLIILSKTI